MQGTSPPAGRLPTSAPARTQPHLTRRRFLVASGLAVGTVALYANEVSRHEIEVVDRDFHIRNLPAAFNGFRIVQISDVHLDEFTEDFFLNQVIARINSLAPDLVVITGDFCSRGPLPRRYSLPAALRCAKLLQAIHCTQRFGVLGNHDAVVGPLAIRGFMESHGTPLLVNQNVAIERGAHRIWLAGLDDCMAGSPLLDLAIPSPALLGRDQDREPVLLMAHEPDYMEKILPHHLAPFIDVVFSGHTHGGQIRLPGVGPVLLPPGGKLYPHGHYDLGSIQLYVNRGLGTVGVPLRFNCPPEITVATLRPDLA